MTTIPETMRIISRNVQHTFEELMKLLLRKTLRPALNPLGSNTKIVYNNYKGRYERGLIGSSPDDNINKYNYIMTHESLGWTDDNLANFRVLAKFIKNNTPQRFPSGHAKIRNSLLSKSKVKFSDKIDKGHANHHPILNQYKNFLTFLTSKNIHHVIANKRASFSYTSDIPYNNSFKQLESIGKDIIDQTDPSINSCDSSKMSTAMLRVKLYILENDLANLSVEHPNIYQAYIEMLRIINSVPRSKMVWVINLIATLSYQAWDQLTEEQQTTYCDVLGEDFICAFNDNELITILLQSGSSEIILTSSYFYPLLKMLFIAFGYSKLVPMISDKSGESEREFYREKLRKHFEKYRGASFRRGDSFNQQDDRDGEGYNEIPNPHHEDCRPEAEPTDPLIYEFIKLFGDLYPTIIGLMGGTEVFPPEAIEIDCNNVPSNYDCLASLPEYLWRFNDYSYCRYIEYINAKQMNNALSTKVNAKAKYLQTI